MISPDPSGGSWAGPFLGGASGRSPPIRRAELLAALSVAADFGTGQPPESALRSVVVAAALGRAMGFAPRELRDIYTLAFLRHVGCTAEAALSAEILGGDEIAASPWIAAVDRTKRGALAAALARHLAPAGAPLRRTRLMLQALMRLPRLDEVTRAQCEVAQALANDLGCDLRVRDGLGHAFERWDGKGVPGRRRGAGLCPAMRVVQVADDAQLFHRAGGAAAVTAMLAARAGKSLDPSAAAAMRAHAPDVLATLETDALWDAALAAEPGTPEYVAPDQLDVGLQALGAFADLRSRFTRGHSGSVAELAAGGAEELGLDAGEVDEIRRAGYVHDVGRAGVTARVWDKAGPLTEGEWAEVRKHTGYTLRILARPAPLARWGALGALDHERLDGSGYDRQVRDALPPGARLLAVADMYQAMREARPHRRAIGPDEIAGVLQSEAAAGRLDGEAIGAVLAAARERRARTRQIYPVGLSNPEGDVVRLVSHGLKDRDIGAQLKMSPITVARHLRSAYDKIGVTTREGAAMFAMRHGFAGED